MHHHAPHIDYTFDNGLQVSLPGRADANQQGRDALAIPRRSLPPEVQDMCATTSDNGEKSYECVSRGCHEYCQFYGLFASDSDVQGVQPSSL